MKVLSFKTNLLTIPYVIQDSLDALNQLGHTTRIVDTDREPRDYLINLIEEIKNFKPDFIFTVDHIGVAPGVFNQLKIPYASWFIDEPERCLDPFRYIDRHELTRLCTPFVWDRAYIEALKRFGFENVYYLPLAANPSIFRKMELSGEDEIRYSCNISFVGGSDIAHYRKYCLEPKDRRIQILIEEVIQAYIQTPGRGLEETLEEREKASYYTLSFKDDSQKRRILLGLEFAAMTRFRKEMMEVVSDLGLVLYGDKGWQEVIGDKVQFKGWIDNRTDLPKLYNASRINLNITKSQGKSSLNMRVFEVLSCGGFLLSDYREDLGRLFKLDEEVVCYHSKEELRKKAEYYLAHPEERREIAGLARRRVLAEHTYRHRMEELVRIMKGRL